MSKRFHRGLVVGKFSPLHRGHELVIRRALDECTEVILVSYSKPEMPGCDAARREKWLASLFPRTRRLVVTDERLRQWLEPTGEPGEVPANDADETTHREFCGFLCQRVLATTVDAVFTSEDYGDAFAAELTRCFRKRTSASPQVKHVLVDRDRRSVPISGTILRQSIHAYREWLAPEVYASFVQRVCFLGGESSGKSTLAEASAREFQTVHVTEFGRELWEMKSGMLAFEDMRRIAKVQVQREDEAVLRANRFLFCDTTPLTTLFYSQRLFGNTAPDLEHMATRSYDFTILCAPDFAFVQDGTRQQEHFRELQHEWYLRELGQRRIPYALVGGSMEHRLQLVRACIGPDTTPIRSLCVRA